MQNISSPDYDIQDSKALIKAVENAPGSTIPIYLQIDYNTDL